MSLASTSIQRPVLATVFSLVILLFGGIGITYLGVREFPSVDPPLIRAAGTIDQRDSGYQNPYQPEQPGTQRHHRGI